jgi:hypothetical protein
MIIGGGYWHYRQVQAYNELIANYKKDLIGVSYDILVESEKIANISDIYLRVWRTCIEHDIDRNEFAKLVNDSEVNIYTYFKERSLGIMIWQGDISKAIDITKEYLTQRGDLGDIQAKEQDIAQRIRKLNKPPKGYEKAYEALLDLYNEYEKYVQAVLYPSGSLVSYSNTIDAITDNLVNKSKQLRVLLPEE